MSNFKNETSKCFFLETNYCLTGALLQDNSSNLNCSEKRYFSLRKLIGENKRFPNLNNKNMFFVQKNMFFV